MKRWQPAGGTGNRLCAWLLLLLLLFPAGGLAQQARPLRVLVLGTDRLGYRKVSENEGMSRADAILLVAVQPGSGGIRVLSVERDYKVELPEGLGVNKLSTATYFGGPQLLLDSVNGLFATDLSYYIQVDIPGAIGIIDSIGGIDVEVLEEELPVVRLSSVIGPTAVAGVNHFDGRMAQAFMRVRDLGINMIESNSARNDRQMRVITAIMRKLPELGIRDGLEVMARVLPLIQTNIPVYDLLLLAQSLLGWGLKTDIEYLRSPFTAYKTRRINMHQVVLVDNMPAEIEIVRKFLLYPEP